MITVLGEDLCEVLVQRSHDTQVHVRAVGASEEIMVVMTKPVGTSKNLSYLRFLCSVPMKKSIVHILGGSEDQKEPSCRRNVGCQKNELDPS